MRIFHHPARARMKEIRPWRIHNRIGYIMTQGKKSFIRLSFPKLRLEFSHQLDELILRYRTSLLEQAVRRDLLVTFTQ
jgi:hypothetical protein